MKHYSVATARQHLAEALDAAEAGLPVVIERRGVRFRLAREALLRRAAAMSAPPLVEILDPAVEAGTWTWTTTPRGARFTARRSATGKRTRR